MNIPRRYIFMSTCFIALEALLTGFVDRPLSEALRDLDTRHHALIDFFRDWTDFGKSKWYLWPSGIGIAACAVLLRKKILGQKARETARRIGDFLLFLFLCGATSGIVTDIIKPILGRARPVELAQMGLYGFQPFSFEARWNSLPSGHATSAFALAFAVTAFFPRLRIPAFLFAVAIALSRIMVNAHFLSDVIAGGAIAFLTFYVLQTPKSRNGIFHIENVIFPIDNSAPKP
jgi:undecaprenyl-diphosphatase